MTNPVEKLAARILRVERELHQATKQPSLDSSSIMDGAVNGWVTNDDGTLTPTVVVGEQWDGTHGTTVLTGPTPPRPSTPFVEALPGGIRVVWDGLYGEEDPLTVAPMDWARCDVVVSTDIGFDPIATPPAASITSPRGGEFFYPGTAGVQLYVALVTRSVSGKASAPSTHASATPTAVGGGASSDGVAPSTAPTLAVSAGLEQFFIQIDGVANADPVTYDIYGSTTSPVAQDAAHLVVSTPSTLAVVGTMADGTPVSTTAPTYFVAIARDEDGSGPASLEVSGTAQEKPAPFDPSGLQGQIDAANADITSLQDFDAGVFPIVETDIQDGAITTPKMTANTIEGDRIKSNTLDAAKIVAGSITTDRMTANSISGDRIAAGTLSADKIVSNSISSQQISSNYVYAGVIQAGQIQTGSLSAALALVGSLTVGDAAGRHITLDPTGGFQVFDSTGNPVVSFPTSGSGAVNSFSGDIVAKGLSISGKAELKGTQNEVSVNSTLTLQSGVTAPANSVTISTSYLVPVEAGYSGSYWYAATLEAMSSNGRDTIFRKPSTATSRTITHSYTAGSGRATATNIKNATDNAYLGTVGGGAQCVEGSPVQIGSYIYKIYSSYKDYGWVDYVFKSDNTALPLDTTNKLYVMVGKFDASTGAQVAAYRWDASFSLTTSASFTYYPDSSTFSNAPVMTTDGTYLYIAQVDPATKKVRIQKFSTALALQSTVTTTDALAPAANTAIGSLVYGNFDYGSARYAIQFGTTVYSVDASTGATQASEQWAAPVTNQLMWNGTRFISGSKYMSTSKSTQTVWAAYSWYDSDSGGTGLHETPVGLTVSAARTPRYGVQLTVSADPADGGGADDPDSARIYAIEAASSTGMTLQGLVRPTARTLSYADGLSTGGAAPLSTGTFPAGSASTLASANGGFYVKGDGTGAWPLVLNPIYQKNADQDTRLNNIESANGTQDNRLTSVENRATNLESRATALEGATAIGSISRVTDQSIPNNSTTQISWGTTGENTPSGFANTANNRLLVPKAGLYLVELNLVWTADSSATGIRQGNLLVNAAIVRTSRLPSSGASVNYNTLAVVLRLTTSDAITASAFQNSGVAKPVGDGSYLQATYIGH